MKHQAIQMIKIQEAKDAELALLRGQVPNLMQSISSLKNQLAAKDKLITKQSNLLRQKDTQISSAYNSQSSHLSNKNKEIEILKIEVKNLKNLITKSEKESSKKDEIIKLLSKAVDDLNLDKADLKNDKVLLLKQNTFMQQEIDNLKGKLKDKNVFDDSDLNLDLMQLFEPPAETPKELNDKSQSNLMGNSSQFSIIENSENDF